MHSSPFLIKDQSRAAPSRRELSEHKGNICGTHSLHKDRLKEAEEPGPVTGPLIDPLEVSSGRICISGF
ncbi:hypothetical protein EYF80_005002 [Liparis tanakae]|uniref:Uncharacterized protein n=1 Tax=Liparis tanakae TaxID=230148 RepID=A0A4Z2J4L1_9TELE|nr:hypothetical protein EYF80_005002 [Liparis tanakae]